MWRICRCTQIFDETYLQRKSTKFLGSLWYGLGSGHSYFVRTVNKPKYNHCFWRETYQNPDASTFWRIISEHKVGTMFTAPTAIRAIKKKILTEYLSNNTI
jgi:propionyl-CoA synthetase